MALNKQINNDLNYIQHSWFCPCCSNNFYKYIEEFVHLNSDCLRVLNNMKKRSTILRSDKNKFISSMKILLREMSVLKSCLESGIFYSTEASEMRQYKYPIPKNNKMINQYLNEKSVKRKFLSYNDLEDFYNYCHEKDYLRDDIADKEFALHFEDVEYIENKYKFSFNQIKFPRKKERGNLSMDNYLESYLERNYGHVQTHFNINYDGIVVSELYDHHKAVLLNIFEDNYCDECREQKMYYECIGEKMYILSGLTSIIFNSLDGNVPQNLIHKDKEFEKFKKVIQLKLNEISKEWKHEPYCTKWKGVLKYHEILGIIPKILDDAGVPDWHYFYRVDTYFNDIIKGHPKASNGWLYDSLQELHDMNVFKT